MNEINDISVRDVNKTSPPLKTFTEYKRQSANKPVGENKRVKEISDNYKKVQTKSNAATIQKTPLVTKMSSLLVSAVVATVVIVASFVSNVKIGFYYIECYSDCIMYMFEFKNHNDSKLVVNVFNDFFSDTQIVEESVIEYSLEELKQDMKYTITVVDNGIIIFMQEVIAGSDMVYTSQPSEDEYYPEDDYNQEEYQNNDDPTQAITADDIGNGDYPEVEEPNTSDGEPEFVEIPEG